MKSTSAVNPYDPACIRIKETYWENQTRVGSLITDKYREEITQSVTPLISMAARGFLRLTGVDVILMMIKYSSPHTFSLKNRTK